ncbi:DUF3558 domain-containing protein [Saccharothrix algeriensis]|uniref:DUF3558 domain-containing protein n=1 Tax=Saccharothrix algeriensis TaxID=173560 RepID=A0A8T8I1K6_9PSEU|nr:DUF3558 domain-containing protein [Saccharothrix algeriensis]MBM7810625.1 hypothetical protein [Saccharothrix algeriensis]QTR04712.1 DUF3558 domain-containing protein [Saccharothrix algeriensis]
MRRLLPTSVAALGLVLTACAPGTTGSPTPGSTPPAPESTSTPTSPQRPREIKLDGKDACQLLSSDQLPALRIDRPGKPRESDLYQATGCSWTVTGAGNSLVPVTKEGIEVWTAGKREGRSAVIEPVLGFPAISVTLPTDELRCDVMVDTSEGQYLTAGFDVTPSYRDKFPEPCDGARRLAEAAMQNLLK